jgi:hypothetical protein
VTSFEPSVKKGASGVFRAMLFAMSLLLASCGSTKRSTEDNLHSGFAELRAAAATNIREPARLNRYLELAERMESEFTAYEHYARGFVAEYRRTFINHTTAQDDLRKLGIVFRSRQREAQDRFVGLHLAMARIVTPDEWRTLSEREAAIVEALLTTAKGAE